MTLASTFGQRTEGGEKVRNRNPFQGGSESTNRFSGKLRTSLSSSHLPNGFPKEPHRYPPWNLTASRRAGRNAPLRSRAPCITALRASRTGALKHSEKSGLALAVGNSSAVLCFLKHKHLILSPRALLCQESTQGNLSRGPLVLFFLQALARGVVSPSKTGRRSNLGAASRLVFVGSLTEITGGLHQAVAAEVEGHQKNVTPRPFDLGPEDGKPQDGSANMLLFYL